MEARAGNSNLDFETLFSDFQELLNGSGLTVVRGPATQRQEFLERGEIFKQKFPRGGPSKKLVSIFFNKLLHRPGPLT